MNILRSVLYKSLVKPYYKRNAGLLCFVYYIMFLAVASGVREYHYALIRGMLTSPSFLLIVLFMWLAYAIKCAQFIVTTLRQPEFSFLYMLSLVNAGTVYRLLLQVQLILFLPVLTYVIAILGVGYHEHWYTPSLIVLIFNVSVCVISAWWYLYLLRNHGAIPFEIRWKLPALLQRKYYTGFLFRYVLENCKALYLVIKIYNCLILYLMLDNRNPGGDQDLRMIVLFYSFGLLGHGVLIHRLKEMENTRMIFYRGLPVSTGRRLVEYGWFCFCLLIPEMITIISRTPAFLYYSEACFLVFFGYAILLLLNSLQLFNYTGLKDYLLAVAQILFAVIIAMISRQLYALSVLLFFIAIGIFFRRYYLFEPRPNNAL